MKDFRLAIEEIEAWYLGDRQAIVKAYPKATRKVLDGYEQDSVCGTWEILAEATHSEKASTVKNPGQLKHEWAERIPTHMDIDNNASPSFNKFVEGLKRITS